MTKAFTSSDLDAAAKATEAALQAGIAGLLKSFSERDSDLGDLGHRAVSVVRSHPIATAVVGLGLAWLATTARSGGSKDPNPEALMGWEDEGGAAVPVGKIDAVSEAWMDRAVAARDMARKRLEALYDDGRATVREQGKIAEQLATDLAAAFRHDLSDLTDDAAERVALARERAWDAVDRGRSGVQSGLAKGAEFARQNPATTAVAGLAAAAALTALAPKARPVVGRVASATASVAASALMAEATALLTRERTIAAKLEGMAERLRARADAMVEDLSTAMATGRDTAEAAASQFANRARSVRPQ